MKTTDIKNLSIDEGKTMYKINATQHAGMYTPPNGQPCWYSVADAAESAGVSPSAIRRAIMRSTTVTRISGPSVAGMIEIDANGRRGFLPYYE